MTLYAQWSKNSTGGNERPESKPNNTSRGDRDRRGREINKILEPKIEFELNM